jgi:capsular exopolysaccharide synthesis family protein
MNGSSEQTRRISLRDLLTIIFSKRYVFLGILATIVAINLAVALLADPVYKVTGSVLVKPLLEQNLKLMAPTAASMSAQPVTMQDINSEVNILSSPQLLRQVVKKLQLDKPKEPKTFFDRMERSLQNLVRSVMQGLGLAVAVSPEDQALFTLQKKLSVKPIALSNVIEISLSGKSAEEITKIVNTVLEDYIDYHVSLFRTKGAREFYARQADLFQKSLRQAEEDLEKFKKEWSIVDISVQNEANIQLVRMMRENLAVVQANIADRQTKVGAQKRNMAKTGELGAFTKDFQDNTLQELVRAMGPLLAERERTALHFQKSSPKYQAINLQVEELKQEYHKKVKELLQGSALDLSGLSSYAQVLKNQIGDIEKKTVLLSEKEVEYERLVREVKQQEKNYLLYVNKTEEARIEEQQDNSRVSNVSVTNWAKAPTIPVFPRKVLMTILSLFIGSFLGLAGVFTAYYLDHTVKTPEDIARSCRTPMMTFIPDQAPLSGGPGVAAPGTPGGKSQARIFSSLPVDTGGPAPPGGPPSGLGMSLWMGEPTRYPGLLDNFRTLKNSLHSLEKSGAMKVIQFTGVDREVGVTTVASNLALVLAWDLFDHRILLVDASLANPATARAFGGSQEPGLLNYLTNDVDLQQVVQPTIRPNLEVIGTGRATIQVLSPFNLLKFDTFLEEARNRYDYVVMDTAPILRSSDSFIISGKVDGVILVAKANHSRYEVINDIESRLQKEAKLTGIVLNRRRFVIPKILYKYV